MVVADLLTPWATNPIDFASNPPELVELVRRQRAPTEKTLPAPEGLAALAKRAGEPALVQLLQDAESKLSSLGLDQTQTVALIASAAPGSVAEALPDRSGGRVALFLDRADDTNLVRGLASAKALLTRWRHPASAIAAVVATGSWDRWQATRAVPLVEWYYSVGLSVHAEQLIVDVPDHKLIGVSKSAFDRLRHDEEELVQRLDDDLNKAGAAVVIRWLEDHAPPTLRKCPDGFVVPVAAGRYLAWRDLRERVNRVGVATACGMPL